MDRQKSQTYRVNLKLNIEQDAELIAWIEQHAHGSRSAAIREALRIGMGSARPQPELIAKIVREAIREALKGIQVAAVEQDIGLNTNEIEDTFGTQLDQLLDHFG